MATIGREQAAALLKHRCDLTSLDGEIDDSALQSGSPAACVALCEREAYKRGKLPGGRKSLKTHLER